MPSVILACPKCGMQGPRDECTECSLCPSCCECRRCRQCGCTDNFACDGGCYWVEDNLCSACKEAA